MTEATKAPDRPKVGDTVLYWPSPEGTARRARITAIDSAAGSSRVDLSVDPPDGSPEGTAPKEYFSVTQCAGGDAMGWDWIATVSAPAADPPGAKGSGGDQRSPAEGAAESKSPAETAAGPTVANPGKADPRAGSEL